MHRWWKVEKSGDLAAEKFKINYSLSFIHYFGHISAVGEREAMNCLELSRMLRKPQVETWLLLSRHHWSLFTRVTNCTKVEGPCPSTFKFGPPCPPVLPPMLCESEGWTIGPLSWCDCTLAHLNIILAHLNIILAHHYTYRQYWQKDGMTLFYIVVS